MSPGYGFAGHVGLAQETIWGTPVAVASGDFIEALSENITLAIERFETKNIVGRYAEPDDSPGMRRIEGELVMAAHPIQLGYFLRAALGLQPTVTVVLSGFLWSNAFTPTTSEFALAHPLPPYTLEVFRDVTSAHRYSGVQATKLALAVDQNQDLRVTLGLMAKTSSLIARSTPTYPQTGTQPFTYDTTSLQVGGAAIDYIESLAIEFDNQLEGIGTLNNTAEIARVRRNGSQTVRISGTIGFESLAEYFRFIQQSEAELVAAWTKPNSFAFRVRIPRMIYTAFPLGLSGRDRSTVGFEGMGRYEPGSGYAIEAVLTTTRSVF